MFRRFLEKLFPGLGRRRGIEAARLYFVTGDENLLSSFSDRDNRLDSLLSGVVRLAVKRGLKFNAPGIYLIKEGIARQHVRRSTGEVVGVALATCVAVKDTPIFIFYDTYERLNDMELSVVIAHELGHVIDFQTKTKDHPLFKNIDHLDREMFANAIASYIYSKLVVVSVLRKIGVSFNEERLVQVNLNHPAP